MFNLFKHKKYYTFESAADIETYIDTYKGKWNCVQREAWMKEVFPDHKMVKTKNKDVEIVIYKYSQDQMYGVVWFDTPPEKDKLPVRNFLKFGNLSYNSLRFNSDTQLTEKQILSEEASDLLLFIIDQTHKHC